MADVFSNCGTYSPDLNRVLRRLNSLVHWERRARVRGAARLMRVSAEPARSLLHRLGCSSLSFQAVHVTGSKGKGTVSALIAAGLGLAHTGLFSSPHVERVTERISVRGSPISDAALAAAITRALDAREMHPKVVNATWFDVFTAAALSEFEAEGVRYAVVEVGMGGRRDSTAVLRAPVSVITNVMNEHADIIGPTVEDIAVEKAGVIAPGAKVVLGIHHDHPLAHIIANEAAAQKPRADIVYVPRHEGNSLFEHNLAIARAALVPFGAELSEEDARGALKRLPARQESFTVYHDGRQVDVVLDGAHVPLSVQAVLEEAGAKGATVVLGVGADKDALGICKQTREAGVVQVMVTAVGKEDVYMKPDVLALLLTESGFDAEKICVVDCPENALREAVRYAAQQEVEKRRVIVVGSLHLAGSVRGLLREMVVVDDILADGRTAELCLKST